MPLSTLQKTVLLLALPATALLLYILFRSDEEEDDEYMQDIVTSRQTVIEVSVPRSDVGAVIGCQGVKIKKVQEDSGARVRFKDDRPEESDDQDRILVIRGSQETAQKAEIMIRKILAEVPKIIVEEIFVPQTILGKLIGRGGENIRLLSRVSKARIDIERTEQQNPKSLRSIKLKGAKDCVEDAKGMIAEIVNEFETDKARISVSSANRSQRSRSSNLQGQGDTLPLKPGMSVWPNHSDYVQCYVSAVENPDHFWVQIINNQSDKLDKMIQAMTDIYSKQITANPSIDLLKPGTLVAADFPHDSLWYRAEVIALLPNNIIDLYYLDYGDSGEVSLDKVRMLSDDYCQLPFQAVECKLANIEPKADKWSEESCVDFEQLTYCAKWKILQAAAISFSENPRNTSPPTPHLLLIDTNKEEDLNINEELVGRDHAVFSIKEKRGTVPYDDCESKKDNVWNKRHSNDKEAFTVLDYFEDTETLHDLSDDDNISEDSYLLPSNLDSTFISLDGSDASCSITFDSYPSTPSSVLEDFSDDFNSDNIGSYNTALSDSEEFSDCTIETPFNTANTLTASSIDYSPRALEESESYFDCVVDPQCDADCRSVANVTGAAVGPYNENKANSNDSAFQNLYRDISQEMDDKIGAILLYEKPTTLVDGVPEKCCLKKVCCFEVSPSRKCLTEDITEAISHIVEMVDIQSPVVVFSNHTMINLDINHRETHKVDDSEKVRQDDEIECIEDEDMNMGTVTYSRSLADLENPLINECLTVKELEQEAKDERLGDMEIDTSVVISSVDIDVINSTPSDDVGDPLCKDYHYLGVPILDRTSVSSIGLHSLNISQYVDSSLPTDMSSISALKHSPSDFNYNISKYVDETGSLHSESSLSVAADTIQKCTPTSKSTLQPMTAHENLV